MNIKELRTILNNIDKKHDDIKVVFNDCFSAIGGEFEIINCYFESDEYLLKGGWEKVLMLDTCGCFDLDRGDQILE